MFNEPAWPGMFIECFRVAWLSSSRLGAEGFISTGRLAGGVDFLLTARAFNGRLDHVSGPHRKQAAGKSSCEGNGCSCQPQRRHVLKQGDAACYRQACVLGKRVIEAER